MQKIEVTVPFKEGLHARPATELVKICMGIKCDITLIKGDAHVNPKSILGIMSLGAGFGAALTVQVEGPDEVEAIAKLGTFFAG